jgi:hypothetical protein
MTAAALAASTAGSGGGRQGSRLGAESAEGGTRSGSAIQGRRSTEPYRLRCVAHSLGGMSTLIYMVTRAAQGKPHHIHRLILLTPAGFHDHMPNVSTCSFRVKRPRLKSLVRESGCANGMGVQVAGMVGMRRY